MDLDNLIKRLEIQFKLNCRGMNNLDPSNQLGYHNTNQCDLNSYYDHL